MLRSMSLPSNAASALSVCLGDRGDIVFSDVKNCSISRSFFSNIARSLVSGLSPSVGVFAGSGFVSCYADWMFWGFWPFPGCVCLCVCVGGTCGLCPMCRLPRFILLASFGDTLLVVSILDMVYDCHLRPLLES